MKIRTKLIIIIVSVFAVPSLVGGFFVYQHLEQLLEQKIIGKLDALASTQKSRIEESIEQHFALATLVASRSNLRQLFADALTESSPGIRADLRHVLEDARRAVDIFETLLLVNLKGDVIVATDGTYEGRNIGSEEEMDARFLGTSRISAKQDTEGNWWLLLGSPLKSNGELAGRLLILTRPKSFSRITGDYSDLGDSGETLLGKFDREGRPVFIVPPRFPAPHVTAVNAPALSPGTLELALVKRQSTFSTAVDYRGHTVLAATRYIPAVNLALVVKIDREEAFTELKNLRKNMILLWVSILLAVCLIAQPVTNAIVSPIQALKQGTQRVTAGDWDYRVEIDSRDEIAELGKAFNLMTSSLQETRVSLLEEIEQRAAAVQEKEATIAQLETLQASMLNIMEDLTEKNRELNEAKKSLEWSNKELDDFAYIASHDLKEPIRGVRNYASFLLEDYAAVLDPEGVEKLRTLIRLSTRMNGLIESLLAYSRIGREALVVRETDMAKVVSDALEAVQTLIEERSVKIEVAGGLPSVPCHREWASEVFQNLVSNAAKYNDKAEKRIQIGVITKKKTSKISQRSKHAPPIFYVRDNGIGIREKHHTAVFQIFKRLHRTDEYGGGSGAGLTIVKKLIEKHRGSIWLESAPGEGTTFYFTFEPLSEEPVFTDDNSLTPSKVELEGSEMEHPLYEESENGREPGTPEERRLQ